jgi:hypothetical protein
MRRKRKILLAVAAGLTAIGIVPGTRAYHYTQHDPRFCETCHLMDDAEGSWARSEHKKIDCHDCHVSSLPGNLKRLFFTLVAPKSAVGKHEPIDKATCLKCHESQNKERWAKVLETTGHKVHVEKGNAQCIDCHAQTLHKFMPPAGVCTKCHREVKVHEQKMAGLECLDCHRYLAPTSERADLEPRAFDCRRCHLNSEVNKRELTDAVRTSSGSTTRVGALALAAPVVPLSNTHGGLECDGCHDPHRTDLSDRRSGRGCAKCHRVENEEASARPIEAHQNCRICHAPHGPRQAGKTACAKCHPSEIETITKPHAADCLTCHRPHGLKIDDKTCTSCHDQLGAKLERAQQAEGHACRDCHEMHGEKGTKMTGAACTKCHGDQRDLALTSRAKPHRECKSCHAPHDGPLEADAKRCRACHEDKVRALAETPHDAKCDTCHAKHGPAKAASDSCATCHQNVHVEPGKGGDRHQDCTSCHAVHDAKTKPAERACLRCHASMKDRVLGAPPAKEHTACSSCHEGHDTRAVRACGSCHENALAATRTTKHEACTSCHDAHPVQTAQLKTARAADSSCARCHEGIARSTASFKPNPKGHRACESCHAPHTEKTLACTSCHEQILSAGMHRVEKHQDCASCHTPHKDQTVTKSACMTCHVKEEEAGHFRDAKKCQSCHPF